MVSSLFEHETISTTIQKAKEVKPFAEKLITIARKGNLAARRRAIAMLGNRDIVSQEDGKTVKKGTVIGKLFSEIGPRYLDRPGGYTRIIHLAMKRLGDNGQLVLLQLVGEDEPAKKKSSSTAKAKAKKKTEEKTQASPAAEAVEVKEPEAAEQTEAEPKEAEAKESEQSEETPQ
jgi:large subunit ribosomal protein L17